MQVEVSGMEVLASPLKYQFSVPWVQVSLDALSVCIG